jgi:tetratricopeptide (TPR) repeat protein
MVNFGLEAETDLSDCRKILFAVVSLTVLIFVVYGNTFDASWHFDDGPNIVQNKRLHLQSLTWDQVKETFMATPEGTTNIVTLRPLSRLSFGLNYLLWKDRVQGYHLVNISIHLMASVFLFLTVYHTLRLPSLKAKYGPNAYFVALLSTAFWALNPVQTQAVTYIVQRMASMAAMFYVMALYLYIKWKTAEKQFPKYLYLVLCILAGLFSFGSKENALTLPLVLILYHLLFVRHHPGGGFKKDLLILGLSFLFIGAAALALFSLYGTGMQALFGLYEIRPFSLYERLLTQSRVVIFYISLLFYPVSGRLSVDHDPGLSTSVLDPPSTLISIVVIFVLIFTSLALYRRQPLITFAVLFFFVNHLMESSVLPLELVFEHRNYLPSMFVFVPVSAGFLRALSHFSYRRSMQSLLLIFIVLFLVGEGHATFVRNRVWITEESLWLDCLEKYPRSFRAHHNLGRYYDHLEQDGKAYQEYLQALACDAIHSTKEKAVTYFNLGLIAHKRKAYDRARFYYLKAVEIDPCVPGVHNNLAGLLSLESEAMHRIHEELLKAIHCGHETERAIATSNLGILLYKMGRVQDACSTLQDAMEMDPENPMTRLRLGYVHKALGHFGRAYLSFKKILDTHPADIAALLHLAELYARAGLEHRSEAPIVEAIGLIGLDNLQPYLNAVLRDSDLLSIKPDINLLLPRLLKVVRQEEKQIDSGISFLEKLGSEPK